MKITELDSGHIQSVFWIKEKNIFHHFSKPKKAFLHFRDYSYDLLHQQKVEKNIGETFLDWNDRRVMSSLNSYRVSHWTYEFGHWLHLKEASVEQPLLIDIEYEKCQAMDLGEATQHFSLTPLKSPSQKDYARKFNLVQKHLRLGDCYQLNLTERFLYQLNAEEELSPWQLAGKLWADAKNRAPFAHATLIPSIDLFLLSNSPECLVQKTGNNFYARPMKGTLACGPSQVEQVKGQFKASIKNQAELDIITDLLRNDLSALGRPYSEVVSRRQFIHVPGLLQQYALIRKKIPANLNWAQLAMALFPGGSVTGAPKKRVLELIKSIEGDERGFYCGSTVLQTPKSFSSSINIRSAQINLQKQELLYGSGGGVTLLSEMNDEFQEISQKVASFLSLLG